MATQGPNYPGTITTSVSAGSTWLNATPSQLGADDAANASVTDTSFDTGDLAALIGTNFGFSIPTGATIDGITVEYERSCTAGSFHGTDEFLRNSGASIGTDQTDGSAWTSTPTVKTVGGASNLWGATLTPAIVNGSTFGWFWQGQCDSNNTDIHVDFMRMTVHYTEAAVTMDAGMIPIGF